ncbi:MAG: hypothetical protein QNK89_08285 [Lacinutrix sp.]|uniref:hypothetical protein n=1 Tax=Lacinutrix sp. TaxID=1937692 RepID=UPI0030AAD6FA
MVYKKEVKRKVFLLILVLSFNLNCFAQKEGQVFCEGDETESYFSLLSANKIVYWYDTYYIEKKVGTKTINNKEYIEYSQTWEEGYVAKLFLRQEQGRTYQYEECCTEDTLRFDDNFTINDKWKTADKLVEYQVLETNVALKTPVCNYKNLIKIKYNSKDAFFEFYYLKGFGYVGASVDGKLISCVSAELLPKKDN